MHYAKLGQHTANFGLTVPPKFDFTVPPTVFCIWGYSLGYLQCLLLAFSCLSHKTVYNEKVPHIH